MGAVCGSRKGRPRRPQPHCQEREKEASAGRDFVNLAEGGCREEGPLMPKESL